MPDRFPEFAPMRPSLLDRVLELKVQPWRWFDVRLPLGETALNSFGGIFSGVVITEDHVVVAKFLRGFTWLPLSAITHVRGGWFADKPNDADAIRLWGIELEARGEHYTVGVWNWRPACEIIERAVNNAKVAAR
jgi:hypothetical protein